MKVKNQEAWDMVLEETPEHTYEGRVLRFAERFANAVEARLASGVGAMEDIVEKMVNGPEYRVSSTQLCLVVRTLAKYWVHGAEIKAWYDKRREAGGERTCA